jgi:2-keto-4-pentenoate hydratase/2-oxohepta-3-ene-1,7-dioic acid hydratase in catechol pathway
MRLVGIPGGFGRLEGDAIVPMGRDVSAFLSTGEETDGQPIPFDPSALRAPVPRPGKIICVGLNYYDHTVESGQPIPSEPVLFPKFANSVVGPDDDVIVPAVAQQIDYEAELGVVIGRVTHDVSAEEALDYIGGYLCVNDVSARDLQFATGQWMRGKAIDTFLPTGPWLITSDEVGDPQGLSIRCLVNGEVRQDSNTKEMAYGVAELVSFISQTITLEPGDIIATGTPPGVGMASTPPRYLQHGDEVTVEIEKLGRLTNRIRRA